jgi:hypothetical protein
MSLTPEARGPRRAKYAKEINRQWAVHRFLAFLPPTPISRLQVGDDISMYRPAYPISISYGIDPQSARVLRAGFRIFVQKSFFAQSRRVETR